MKASDIGLLTDETVGFVERATVALQAFKFEVDILAHCQGNNMDRVVVALDYGDCSVIVDGVRDAVFYLIFELADGDARIQVDGARKFNLAWAFGALHDIAVAIRQLHSGDVSHNDIKPANILIFNKALQKLADLGRATSPLFRGIHDEECRLGDPKYAAPEFLYANTRRAEIALCNFDSRRSSDLYHLGSIAHFFVTGMMFTPAVLSRLAPEHRPRSGGHGWSGSFEGIVPFWREAHSRVVEDLRQQLAGVPQFAADALIEVVGQLCEVDPALRGHPINRTGSHDRRGVDRYATLFDLLRGRVIRAN